MANKVAPGIPKLTLDQQLLVRFAQLLRQRYDARLYLFGSRARGTAHQDSDYDLVAVAEAFSAQPLLRRGLDRGDLWREAGGWRIPLDLHCYTPKEFREELAGLGYLGQAKRRGELIEIKTPRARRTVA
ncbi:MAG: nucleotidyltransferase domain-containing protein [Chloroflexi bacterium]|nr:nucleotidyltransferase domain-containing protein [Chloroflexota bacterium]